MKVLGMPRWFKYQNWYTQPKDEDTLFYEALTPYLRWAIFAALLFLIATLFQCHATEEKFKPALTQHDTMQVFFKVHGSPVPAVMANAVMQTKRPALMAAIAVKESNGKPWAVGDGGRSKGAFQVQEQHWGDVPFDPVGQALQAERILEDIMRDDRKGKLRQVLARYNGGGKPPKVSYRYADAVILQRGILQ